MAKYMLVSFKTCPWVQRSAIILREKNTPFELRHIEPDNRPDWLPIPVAGIARLLEAA